MLQWIYGTLAEVSSGGRTTKRTRKSNVLCRETIHTLGWRLYPQFMRLVLANVDEQAGV